jgi:serine/threonine-protein kinase RIO1
MMKKSGDWSIEKELVELTDTEETRQALVKMGLLNALSDPYEIKERSYWVRGGAETYVYVADFTSGEKMTTIVLKAMVAPFHLGGPEQQLTQWLERRVVLNNSGVNVPTLFAAKKGMLVEEFIQHDAIEYMRLMDSTSAEWRVLIASLLEMAERVYSAGFRPLSILPNLRIQGGEVVWIDFGSDLGSRRCDSLPVVLPQESVKRELDLYLRNNKAWST